MSFVASTELPALSSLPEDGDPSRKKPPPAGSGSWAVSSVAIRQVCGKLVQRSGKALLHRVAPCISSGVHGVPRHIPLLIRKGDNEHDMLYSDRKACMTSTSCRPCGRSKACRVRCLL